MLLTKSSKRFDDTVTIKHAIENKFWSNPLKLNICFIIKYCNRIIEQCIIAHFYLYGSN